jgi:transcriptional regulator with XRE-family HTH domain
MTDGDTNLGQQFSLWLKHQIELHGIRTTEIIRRGVEAKAFSKVTFYRWLNGEHTPTADNVKFLAEIFGVDPREAYEAAGLTHLMDMEGGIVTATDPVEVFLARVRARRFPKPVEDRLIEYVRAEIEARKQALDELLDTVEDTQRLAAKPGADPEAR